MEQTKTVEEIQAALKTEWSFESIEKYHLNGRGDVYNVKNPIPCYNFDWLIGKEVTIDGKKFKILAVERFAKAGQCNRNEPIGLLVHTMDYPQP